MIRLTLDTAEVRKPQGGLPWRVVAPENGAILAYCDSEVECVRLVAFFHICSKMLLGDT